MAFTGEIFPKGKVLIKIRTALISRIQPISKRLFPAEIPLFGIVPVIRRQALVITLSMGIDKNVPKNTPKASAIRYWAKNKCDSFFLEKPCDFSMPKVT